MDRKKEVIPMCKNNKNRLLEVAKNMLYIVCVIVIAVMLCVSVSRPAPIADVQECAATGSEYQIDGTVIECTDLGEVSICDANGDVWVVITDSELTCDDTVVLTLMDNGTTDKEDDEVVNVYNVTTHSTVQ